jgi:hypothetical protein
MHPPKQLRNDVIYDAYVKYKEVCSGAITESVRASFSEMILVSAAPLWLTLWLLLSPRFYILMPHHEQTNTLELATTAAAVPSVEPPSDESPLYISDADEYFYCFRSLGRPDVVLIGGTKDLDLELTVLLSSLCGHSTATL